MFPKIVKFSPVFIVYHLSWKGLIEKEAMERTHSEEEADLDDPDWEVDPKFELEVDIKDSDDIKDDVSQQKPKTKTK